MRVKIQSINNRGDYHQEYVSLLVVESCDIGRYLLSDSTYTDKGQLSNKVRHIFWFPDKSVKRCDYVRLYTRSKGDGDKSECINQSGTTTHVFYWNLRTSVWNDEGDYAVLFEVSDWDQKGVGPA